MKIKNLRTKLAGLSAVAATAMAASPAFAQSGLDAAAATAEMDKTILYAIGIVVLGISGVVAMIKAGRRATGG